MMYQTSDINKKPRRKKRPCIYAMIIDQNLFKVFVGVLQKHLFLGYIYYGILIIMFNLSSYGGGLTLKTHINVLLICFFLT